MPSYYEILGVPSDADADAIARAYTAAVREATTADGGPGPRVRQLDEAYAVLGTEERRRRYDDLRAAEAGGGGNPELLALLAVIGETGRLPTADEVVGPPVTARRSESTPATPPAHEPTPTPATPPAHEPTPTPATPPAHESTPAPQGARPPVRPAEDRNPADADRAADQDAPETAAPPAPVRPATTMRRGPRMPGTDADRRTLGRRRTTVAAGVVGLLVGAGAGVLLAGSGGTLPIDAGSCVSLTSDEGRAVPCTSAEADARVRSMVEEPGQCEPSPAGYLVRADGRVACLAER